MKKSKYISLVLISAALASCDRQLTDTGDGDVYEQGKPNVYMRSDTTQDYTPVTANTYINYYGGGGNMWYYAFRPYYGYYNGGYYGYYGNNFFGWNNSFYHPGNFQHFGGPYNPGNNNIHRGNEGGGNNYGPHTTIGGFGQRSASGGGSAIS